MYNWAADCRTSVSVVAISPTSAKRSAVITYCSWLRVGVRMLLVVTSSSSSSGGSRYDMLYICKVFCLWCAPIVTTLI